MTNSTINITAGGCHRIGKEFFVLAQRGKSFVKVKMTTT